MPHAQRPCSELGRERAPAAVGNAAVGNAAVGNAGTVAATLLAALAFAACAGGNSALELNAPYGASSAAPAASSAAGPSLPTWGHLDESRTWKQANARRFNSAGHYFGRFDADVRVNDVGAAAYATIGPGRALPVGSIVVKVHTLPGAGGAAPLLAMEKGDDGWRYVEMDDVGRVLRAGRLRPCVDCHVTMATQDELFGVPTTGR